MAKTLTEIFRITMGLMDEILDTGLLSSDDTISYEVRVPSLVNQLQVEILRDSEQYSFKNYSFNKIDIVAGNFSVVAHKNEDKYLLGSSSAKAYYFEVDNDATVYIEDYDGSWNTLKTVSATSTGGFTAYKGIVTPTANATASRIRFSGSYYYNIINTALYDQTFELDADVPVYRPYVKIDLPDDFGILVDVVVETTQNYFHTPDYKMENNSDLYVAYAFTGSLRVNYRPIPALTTTLTDSVSLDDYTAVSVLPYGLAAKLLIHEDLTKADYFEQKYQEALFKIKQPKPAQASDIEDAYGGFNG